VPWLFLLAAWVLGFMVVGGAYALWNRKGLSLHLGLVARSMGSDDFAAELPE